MREREREKGREGRRKEVSEQGRKDGRKKLSFSWVQPSKKRRIMVVPLWLQRTRGRHNLGGKKKKEGGKRREG